MCSVIEIKNADEYYIHYHSPESLMINPAEKMDNNTKIKSHLKDSEVTSDRGSSASPSLEDEDQDHMKNNSKNNSKIPVRNGNKKKSPAPQPPKKAGKNPFLEDEREAEQQEKTKKVKKSALPRPRSTSNLSRSCENVPITVNSHIPADPARHVNGSAAAKKVNKVTAETGTQVEDSKEVLSGGLKKSASEEHLVQCENAEQKENAEKAVLRSSESSDPICGSPVKKWSYTNGRHLFYKKLRDLFTFM